MKMSNIKAYTMSIIFCIILGVTILGYLTDQKEAIEHTALRQTTEFNLWWRALCIKESSNNPNAYNKANKEKGIVQITPLCLEDAVAFHTKKYPDCLEHQWTDESCYDERESQEIFIIYTNGWIDYFRLRPLWEHRIRIWKGGPYGYQKPSTVPYWKDVKRIKERL